MKFSIIQKIIIAYAVYGIVFFVPATSSDTYYDLYFGAGYFVNRYVWYALSGSVIMISCLKILFRKFSMIELLTLFVGLFLVFWNLSLSASGISVNFGSIGLLLLTLPAIMMLTENQIFKIIKISIVLLVIYSVLNYLGAFLSLQLSPIAESRYLMLTQSLDGEGFRISNTILYGQKNAAGGVLSGCMLLLLFSAVLNKSIRKTISFWVFIALGFLITVSTFSAGGCLVIVFSVLIFWAITNRSAFSKGISIIIPPLLIVYLLSKDLSLVFYKIDSFSVKLERIGAFFDYIMRDQTVLFMGEVFAKNGTAQGFYTESSWLDFWLNFGLVGVVLLSCVYLYLISEQVTKKCIFGLFVSIMFFLFPFTQNSSLMPANILILLMFIALSNKNVRFSGIRRKVQKKNEMLCVCGIQ